MANIDDLRKEVRKRRAAVTAKENRIRRNTGVDIKGSKADPRRDPKVINKYNARQLNSYLKELNNFMLRENGYVPDSSGGLIPKRDWLNYKRGERKYNKIVKQHFEKIADIKDPYRNVTIREAERLFVPESKRAAGEIRHRPFNEIIRDPKNIKSAEALKKLADQIKRKSDPKFLDAAIKAGRKQAGQMLDNAGLSSLKAAVAKLSDKQFDVLWNYWGFAGRLAQIGESGGQRGKTVEGKDVLDAQERDNIKEDIQDFIDNAKKLKFSNNQNRISSSGLTNKQKNQKFVNRRIKY